ncbi:uncharacterized protein BJ171DRAFT_461895, partial [Polychytrium aggregatum]|uniref:uncharacterized protein n=1 Tax=Polychytrium aggregatum TaxID=110093 RepID=UPI0022FED5C6
MRRNGSREEEAKEGRWTPTSDCRTMQEDGDASSERDRRRYLYAHLFFGGRWRSGVCVCVLRSRRGLGAASPSTLAVAVVSVRSRPALSALGRFFFWPLLGSRRLNPRA